jgi:hypothetical protein
METKKCYSIWLELLHVWMVGGASWCSGTKCCLVGAQFIQFNVEARHDRSAAVNKTDNGEHVLPFANSFFLSLCITNEDSRLVTVSQPLL